MGARKIDPALQLKIAREVLDSYRLVEDVAKEFGVSGSTAARYAAIEREGRKRAAEAAREAAKAAPVVHKDQELINFQGTTIKELRETNADLRGKVRTYEYTFSLIREALIEAENQTGQ